MRKGSGTPRNVLHFSRLCPGRQPAATHEKVKWRGVPDPSPTQLFLLGGLLDLLRQLLELLRERRPEALDRSLDAVDAELGRQLLLVEEVVARRFDRHGGLDRDR